jgi:NAD(P)-dependent dehydrogenase (short-subunit alcohol dehydrogenase family)
MTAKTIAVIGATGVVGRGIVQVLADAGHDLICVGRRATALDELARHHQASPGRVSTLAGNVGSKEDAQRLAAVLGPRRPAVIINTISGAPKPASVFDLSVEQLDQVLHENLTGHLLAAQALLPILAPQSLYLGIGGGMADLIFPNCASISMNQAAQRVLYRYLAAESKNRPVAIRTLILQFMITPGDTTPEHPHSISAAQVGQHVAAIIADPARFEGPVLTLKNKQQIGLS